MKFKIGVGLLLFGILLANGAVFDIGGILFFAGCCVGAVGLAMIAWGKDDDDTDDTDEQK